MKKLLMFAAIISVVAFLLLGMSKDTKKVQANQNPTRAVAYYSYEIELGDTLWSVADRYLSPEYGSVENYIKVIKKLNNMTSDKLYDGRHLLIPIYYDVAPVEMEVSAAK